MENCVWGNCWRASFSRTTLSRHWRASLSGHGRWATLAHRATLSRRTTLAHWAALSRHWRRTTLARRRNSFPHQVWWWNEGANAFDNNLLTIELAINDTVLHVHSLTFLVKIQHRMFSWSYWWGWPATFSQQWCQQSSSFPKLLVQHAALTIHLSTSLHPAWPSAPCTRKKTWEIGWIEQTPEEHQNNSLVTNKKQF